MRPVGQRNPLRLTYTVTTTNSGITGSYLWYYVLLLIHRGVRKTRAQSAATGKRQGRPGSRPCIAGIDVVPCCRGRIACRPRRKRIAVLGFPSLLSSDVFIPILLIFVMVRSSDARRPVCSPETGGLRVYLARSQMQMRIHPSAHSFIPLPSASGQLPSPSDVAWPPPRQDISSRSRHPSLTHSRLVLQL